MLETEFGFPVRSEIPLNLWSIFLAPDGIILAGSSSSVNRFTSERGLRSQSVLFWDSEDSGTEGVQFSVLVPLGCEVTSITFAGVLNITGLNINSL